MMVRRRDLAAAAAGNQERAGEVRMRWVVGLEARVKRGGRLTRVAVRFVGTALSLCGQARGR